MNFRTQFPTKRTHLLERYASWSDQKRKLQSKMLQAFFSLKTKKKMRSSRRTQIGQSSDGLDETWTCFECGASENEKHSLECQNFQTEIQAVQDEIKSERELAPLPEGKCDRHWEWNCQLCINTFPTTYREVPPKEDSKPREFQANGTIELSCLHFASWICQECATLYCDNRTCDNFAVSTRSTTKRGTEGNICPNCMDRNHDPISEQIRIMYEMRKHLKMLGSTCKTGECD